VLVNDTPIGHDHRHGRPTRVDENIPATAVVHPRPGTLAGTGRHRRQVPGRVRLRHRPPERRRHPTADAAAVRRISRRWGFAIYLASKDGYQDSVLPTGAFAGAPEDALDTACGLYLGDPTAWI
jgi:hypothetical protein